MFIYSVLAVLLAYGADVWAETKKECLPNIVIMFSDDLGYADLGCYNGPVETPVLDGLAANGMRFTDFYSGCVVCSPSRAVLLTGRHHIRTGVWSWINDGKHKEHLLESEITIAKILKDAGYATAHIGKWHLGLTKVTPDQFGFDYWMAVANNFGMNPGNFSCNGKPARKQPGYPCEVVVNDAIRWLEKDYDNTKPFFLNLWFHEPHTPLDAPEDLVAKYKAREDKSGNKKNGTSSEYSASIDNMDQSIGRLLKKLAQVAPMENTLIIYASDNGSPVRDRVGGLRGGKSSNYEGGIRVPGIFSWPAKIAKGQTMAEPAGVVDILPTICAIVGQPIPGDRHIDGSDISPLLLGNKEAFKRHQPLYWFYSNSRPVVAMRDGKYSLVADPAEELETDNVFDENLIPMLKSLKFANYRLYDLEKDPGQVDDLAQKNPELLERLKKKLLEINASVMAEGSDWSKK